MPKTAQDALSKTILRVDAAETLTEKMDEVRAKRTSHVAVFAQGQCLGVSDFNNVGFSPGDSTFGDLVKGQRCVAVSGVESVERLCDAFADPRIRALVVRDEMGEFTGVVTRQSLLEALLNGRSPNIGSRPGLMMTQQERTKYLLAGEKRILEIISKSGSENGGLTALARFVQAQSDEVACSILLMESDGTRLRMGASTGLPASMVREMDGMQVGPNSGACGTAAFNNQTVIVTDVAAHPICNDFCKLALKHRIRAFCSSPIHSSTGTVLGTIAMYFKRPQAPDKFQKALIGRAVYLAAIAIERKRSEDALRASEARNRTLLESSPVCTKIIDLESRLQYMSAAGKKQLKLCDVESYYGSIFPPKLYPERWRATVAQLLERAKAGETSQLECPVLDTDGNEIWYDTTFVPARDDRGQVQYIIVTSVNVTERRKAEEAARRHRNELAHVSRISTMGELATGLAHELNQPLCAIASYSFVAKSIVEQCGSKLPDLKQVFGKLEEQAIRAGDIVRRLRGHVAKAEPVLVWADLNSLVRDVATLVAPDVRLAKTILNLVLGESMPAVLVDKIKIQQVIVNLVLNAVDAMEETPAHQREITIETRIRPDGKSAEVVVADTGRGIAADELERVFTSFFSTKQEGMGMGLPISRSIVEELGGKLWSKSNIGCGATFGFTIPCDNLDDTNPRPSVYIVDDDSAIRDALARAVRAAGFIEKCYSSAVAFLGAVAPGAISRSVCLVVDIQMPGLDGTELLEEINRWDKGIPVILITGHGTPAMKLRAQELGAVALLEKPFRMSDFQELVIRTLDRTAG